MGNPANNSGDILVRTARDYDLQSLSEILTESFHPYEGLNRWTYPLLKIGIYEDLKSRLHFPGSHYNCLVATIGVSSLSGKNQQIAGTVELTLRSFGWNWHGQKYPYISNLAVSPNYRRRGVARKLLSGCEKAVSSWGFNELYLHVLDNNQQARDLYHSCGYRLERVEANYGAWFRSYPHKILLHKTINPLI